MLKYAMCVDCNKSYVDRVDTFRIEKYGTDPNSHYTGCNIYITYTQYSVCMLKDGDNYCVFMQPPKCKMYFHSMNWTIKLLLLSLTHVWSTTLVELQEIHIK